MSNLENLRKNQNLADLLKAAESASQTNKFAKKEYPADYPVDLWSCKADAAGNGSAVIRFLPAPAGENVPWAKLHRFSFKSELTGKWYIANSPTTLGRDHKDPMVEFNNALYATKETEKIELAKKQKMKKMYFANILVVNDPADPSKNGQVFLFRFGQKIFDKILLAMKPNNEGIDPDDWVLPIDPFSPDTGANFNLRMVRVNGQASFDTSSFGKSKPLASNDADIEAILNKCKSIAAITAPDKFQSYEELERKLNWAMGISNGATQSTASVEKPKPVYQGEDSSDEPDPVSDDDTDSNVDYYRSLANS